MSVPIQAYRKWKQLFERAGARFVRQDAKNHLVWAYQPRGAAAPIPIALVAHSDGADVKPKYITIARRAWKLRPKDGVSDHDFMNGNWPGVDAELES